MHYKNGREAKVGDKVVGKDCNGKPIGGLLIEVFQGSVTCNGYVFPMSQAEQIQRVVTLGDCMRLDDFETQTSVGPGETGGNET